MNVWVRNGEIPENQVGPCLILRLPANGPAAPVIDMTADSTPAAMARLAAATRNGGIPIVASDDAAVLMAAAAMGADGLVVSDTATVDLDALKRIAEALGSKDGTDAYAEPAEPCLTVRRPLGAGAVLEADDIDVAPTAYRGLGAAMRDHVIGLRLRYAVAPGEALHFGHFHDRHAQ